MAFLNDMQTLAQAVAGGQGLTVQATLREPVSGDLDPETGTRDGTPEEHTVFVVPEDERIVLAPAPGGAHVGRAERVFHVEASQLGPAPARGWEVELSDGTAYEVLSVEGTLGGKMHRLVCGRAA